MSPAPSRPVPYVGMPVRVMHLGMATPALIEAVSDDRRTLTVDGERYTLRMLNGRFVREGLPYYGVWLSLREL
jgi:hypothetical protein